MTILHWIYVIVGLLFVFSCALVLLVLFLTFLEGLRQVRELNLLVNRLKAELVEMDRWCAEDQVVVETVKRVMSAVNSIQRTRQTQGILRDVEDIGQFRERIRKINSQTELKRRRLGE